MARLPLEFSFDADADLTDSTNFAVERFGREVALAYARGLTAACERLRDFPQIAPVQPGLRPETRCLIHRSHRIFYIAEPDRVLIVRILHQSRATPTAL